MNILLAEGQPRVRFALRVLLERQPGYSVAGEATDFQELLEQIETVHPDLVLLGWGLPNLNGADSLAAMHKAHPDLHVIVLSGRPESRRAALDAGADAFVSKTEPPEKLLAAVERLFPKTARV